MQRHQGWHDATAFARLPGIQSPCGECTEYRHNHQGWHKAAASARWQGIQSPLLWEHRSLHITNQVGTKPLPLHTSRHLVRLWRVCTIPMQDHQGRHTAAASTHIVTSLTAVCLCVISVPAARDIATLSLCASPAPRTFTNTTFFDDSDARDISTFYAPRLQGQFTQVFLSHAAVVLDLFLIKLLCHAAEPNHVNSPPPQMAISLARERGEDLGTPDKVIWSPRYGRHPAELFQTAHPRWRSAKINLSVYSSQ